MAHAITKISDDIRAEHRRRGQRSFNAKKKVTVSMILASTESMITIFHNLDKNIITDIGKKRNLKVDSRIVTGTQCYRKQHC